MSIWLASGSLSSRSPWVYSLMAMAVYSSRALRSAAMLVNLHRFQTLVCCSVVVLVTCDEEIGSATRAVLAEELGRLIERYRVLWTRRSRSGGLKDSVGRLTHMMERLSA